MEFTKRPVKVTAHQWFKNGDHPDDKIEFIGDANKPEETFASEGKVVRRFRNPDRSGDSVCNHCKHIMHVHGWIDTLEGGHIVCPGDWIIKGIKGEMYPCKPDIFKASYDQVPIPRKEKEFKEPYGY